MKINTPFFVFNPKSYMFGEELLKLAKKADKLAEKYPHLSIFVTCPFAEIPTIASNTNHIIVTAQHIDGIKQGRGMGHVLPESIHAAGARASFLNHAERTLTLAQVTQSVKRAKELGIKTILCADSIEEARALATLSPDIILCEPTELIGTGKTSDERYIEKTNQAISQMDENILIMQAAGVSNAQDVYRTLSMGAHGTGCTSGITEATSPIDMLTDMIEAANKVYQEKEGK